MLCAMTNATSTAEANTVWATFVGTSTSPHLSLNTASALDHMASNVALQDINYESVCPEFGTMNTMLNFEERAQDKWLTWIELKTVEELEGTAPGCWLSPIMIPDDGEEEQEGQEMEIAGSTDEEQDGSVTSMESIELSHARASSALNSDVDIDSDDAELAADNLSDGAAEMSFLDAVHVQFNYIHAQDVSEEHRQLLRESIRQHGVISDKVLRTY
jgi:hypothetical protein